MGLREDKRKLVSASDEQAVAFDPVEATNIRNQASSSTRLTIYFGSNSEPQGRTLGIVSNRVSLSPLQLRIGTLVKAYVGKLVLWMPQFFLMY